MELWESAMRQSRIWQASLRLNAPNSQMRAEAIAFLSQAGHAALPCLRVHLLRQWTPRVQFAAAVVLHRLGAPEGMQTLLDAMDDLLGEMEPETVNLLEEAFLTIGSPDATQALQKLWPHLPEWRTNYSPSIASQGCVPLICRVWANLQDPSVLDTLISYATRIPDLFPPTVAAFGQMAVRKLREASQSEDTFLRLLVVRTLQRIPGEPSFQTLVPLLRDLDPEVRAEACRAVTRIGTPQAFCEVLIKALQAGYSTEAAIHALATTGHPLLFPTLMQLLDRAGALHASAHDTPQAVHAALSRLIQVWPPEALVGTVCALLGRPLSEEVLLTGLAYLSGLQGRCPGQEEEYLQNTLWNLLAHPSPRVRTQAAQALQAWGDSNGMRFLDLLSESRPQGSFLEKLTTVLRGGPDASQAATQAVQQVQKWVTHLSREAVVRLSTGASDREKSRTPPPQDPRAPALTRRLLAGGLRILHTTQAVEEAEQALEVSIMAIRALRRLGASEALSAQSELLQALYTRKSLTIALFSYTQDGMPITSTREVAEPVREEAALTLIDFLGSESFGLFIAALEAPAQEVRGTAVLALGRLGDARAVPFLQALTADPSALVSSYAMQAMAEIRRSNPEMMTLLRGSSLPETNQETLLRPLPTAHTDSAPELLLRPTQGESRP